MQNKKLFLILGLLVLLVGAAAFVGGRLLNQRVDPAGFGLPMGGGEQSVFISVNPAPELPTTEPEVTGLFVKRQDNTIVVSSISMPAGGGGGALVMGASPDDASDAPKVEVVVTADTKIYRDATEINAPSTDQNVTIQQEVEAGTLDDLSSQTMIMVWGRRSGDRIIAEALAYRSPIIINEPEPAPAS